jgi:peptidoglycan glycosyltransferase
MTATDPSPATSTSPLLALRPRRVESGILVLVGVVVAVAYGLASFGTSEAIPANLGPFLLWMFGLGFGAHLMNRRFAVAADPVFLPIALLLNGLGYVVITRLDGDLAALQSTWTAIGIGGYVITLILLPRVRLLESYRYLLGLAGIFLLMLPLVPGLGREINGARIWASVGPINFQPGEFAKIALAAFFAAYLVDSRELLRSRLELRDLAPIGLAWAGSLGVMVFERDLGSSLLFFTLFVVVLWVASERWIVLAVGGAMFVVGAVASWMMFGHVQKRVDIWLDPFADPKGDGFQIVEASFALADGGLTGTGLGRGEPTRIPFVETDFIFAAIGEELGLAGSVAVLMAFLLLVGSGLRVALRAERVFEKLFALGLTTLLAVQTFVIVGGVLRVVPLTGITLPFVSYGGSSLVANYVLLGLLVRMSHEQRVALRVDRGDS